MNLPFYFIDFENVQPNSVGVLKPGTCRIKLFLGHNQLKLPLDLSQVLQPFGADVEYIKIAGNGPNAVDFHIAFYIGLLASQHPAATFTIVSRDTGFDPLVKHLAGLKIQCKRVAAIPGSATKSAGSGLPKKLASPMPPAPKAKPTKQLVVTFLEGANGELASSRKAGTTQSRLPEVISRLKGLKAAKPAKLATLESSIKSWFKPALKASELAAIMDSLTASKRIIVTGTKVTYALS